ncbi:dipeptidase [Paratissierella segnis]|uniref:Membrane dipeptidase n=1 Tax=Paratissierella segnis TaxID=2763679 RepID=A0A926EZM6_9FIRM|nr:dipeptidase [Paratissierella segnis]MBC8589195.1 membrane dipeptidase [Paratissierella segnis]
MKYIDMHCDTLMNVPDPTGSQTLKSNSIASIDFNRMKKGNTMAQFFAVFLLQKEMFEKEHKEYVEDDIYIKNCVNTLKRSVEENEEIISMAYNYEDIVKNDSMGKMSALLTIEDGRSVEGSFEKLNKYYDLGIRLITLTWNFENCFGFPNSDDPTTMNSGLKKFGKEAIEYMNELGMIIDVSHLSDGGFYDVAEMSKKPFVASHSNSRTLSPHKRNLTDEMIKVLAEKGGITGINFSPTFLNENPKVRYSSIELLVKHLNYIRNKGGDDILAIGTDFDGVSGTLEIDSVDKMPLLFAALKRDGWSDDLLEKLAYKNTLRVIQDTMK